MTPPRGRWILAFDVTGPLGSATAARFDRDPRGRGGLRMRTAHTETFSPSRRHAANLLPAIRRVLERAGVGLAGLDLLAATRGPGSFTGLRVGLASLHGLAMASGVPAAGFSSLDAAAGNDAGSGAGGRRLVAVDALRGELFAAVYEDRAVAGRIAGPRRIRPEDAGVWARGQGAVRISGPGVSRYLDAITAGAAGVEVAPEVEPLAPAVARLAAARPEDSFLRSGWNLDPLYLRAPDIHTR